MADRYSISESCLREMVQKILVEKGPKLTGTAGSAAQMGISGGSVEAIAQNLSILGDVEGSDIPDKAKKALKKVSKAELAKLNRHELETLTKAMSRGFTGRATDAQKKYIQAVKKGWEDAQERSTERSYGVIPADVEPFMNMFNIKQDADMDRGMQAVILASLLMLPLGAAGSAAVVGGAGVRHIFVQAAQAAMARVAAAGSVRKAVAHGLKLAIKNRTWMVRTAKFTGKEFGALAAFDMIKAPAIRAALEMSDVNSVDDLDKVVTVVDRDVVRRTERWLAMVTSPAEVAEAKAKSKEKVKTALKAAAEKAATELVEDLASDV